MAHATVVHTVGPDRDACSAWRRTLAGSGYEVHGFASPAELIASGLSSRPHCVVSEASPGGLELQERLRERDPTVAIVFVSAKCDVRLIVRAMRAGAIDVLRTPVAEAALLDAVGRAAARAATLRAQEQRRRSALERFSHLTPREQAIFAQLLEGRLNKQIAAALDCQEATVKVHRSRLMRKLELRSLTRLVQFGQDLGWGPQGRDPRPAPRPAPAG
jgi:FixJ family two-component response regulator